MSKSALEAARMFTDKFLTDAGSQQLATMKITVMLSGPTTDSVALAEALLEIGQAFPNDDKQILEGVNRLYSEFLKRK